MFGHHLAMIAACCWFLCAGKVSGELPECTQDLMTDVTSSYYQHFRPHGKGKWTASFTVGLYACLYWTLGMCVCLSKSYTGDDVFAVTGSVVDDVCLILFRMLSWKTVFIVSLRLVWEKVLKCYIELLHLNLLFTFATYRRNNWCHFFFQFS